MREEVLEQMEAARENPESAGTPQDFHFKALQVACRLQHAAFPEYRQSVLLSVLCRLRAPVTACSKTYGGKRHEGCLLSRLHICANSAALRLLLPSLSNMPCLVGLPHEASASLMCCLWMQGELVVAGVFVRVYNEQPTFSVTDAPAFCKGLVSYLHVQTQSPQFRSAQADTQESLSEGARYLHSRSV